MVCVPAVSRGTRYGPPLVRAGRESLPEGCGIQIGAAAGWNPERLRRGPDGNLDECSRHCPGTSEPAGFKLLQLHNVRVIYRGGPVPHMQTFACVDCTFDVQLRQAPPGQARSLVRGILSLGSENFSINVADN